MLICKYDRYEYLANLFTVGVMCGKFRTISKIKQQILWKLSMECENISKLSKYCHFVCFQIIIFWHKTQSSSLGRGWWPSRLVQARKPPQGGEKLQALSLFSSFWLKMKIKLKFNLLQFWSLQMDCWLQQKGLHKNKIKLFTRYCIFFSF